MLVTWEKTRSLYRANATAPHHDQIAVHDGNPIGRVYFEETGSRAGQWSWSMPQERPDADMAFERSGHEATEAQAKARVEEAYEELLQRARVSALEKKWRAEIGE